MTATIGAILGVVLMYAGLFVAQPMIDAAFGLFIPIEAPALKELLVIGFVLLASAIVSLIPAIRAYKISVSDGMMVKS